MSLSSQPAEMERPAMHFGTRQSLRFHYLLHLLRIPSTIHLIPRLLKVLVIPFLWNRTWLRSMQTMNSSGLSIMYHHRGLTSVLIMDSFARSLPLIKVSFCLSNLCECCTNNFVLTNIITSISETCGNYDPRRRPWFVAASSGPKDVVLVIDTSGSMNDYGRMAIAKEAAITIVETLTVGDRFAVVSFDSTATQLAGEDKLIRATTENKRLLIESIKQLEAGGATNFFDAFNTAFNAISNTIRSESTSGCNIAILFMTDGVIRGCTDKIFKK